MRDRNDTALASWWFPFLLGARKPLQIDYFCGSRVALWPTNARLGQISDPKSGDKSAGSISEAWVILSGRDTDTAAE
jgi:hypothetical protein